MTPPPRTYASPWTSNLQLVILVCLSPTVNFGFHLTCILLCDPSNNTAEDTQHTSLLPNFLFGYSVYMQCLEDTAAKNHGSVIRL